MYEAVKDGGLIFISAQAGINEQLQALPTLSEQAEVTFNNLKEVLQKVGALEKDIVQIVVFIREVRGSEAFANDVMTVFGVLRKVLPKCKTASTAIGVPMLGINGLFLEVQAVAAK
jgi:enamine deaminase RidA (YjgF/YER057c/UK114 family)